jgi:uncharacterized protein YukJ
MPHARTKPPAQQRTYGVLVGTIRDVQEDPAGHSPHYKIWVEADQNYRIAVNVRSVDGSDVVAHYDPNFTKPTKLDLAGLSAGQKGFTPLPTGPGGKGLDYLRDDLFPIDAMAPIPPDGQGVTLRNLLDGQVERAKADRSAVVIAFGEFFQDPGRDQAFEFAPERGVHDIRMIQGNSGSFADDNRINGDGALFIRFTGVKPSPCSSGSACGRPRPTTGETRASSAAVRLGNSSRQNCRTRRLPRITSVAIRPGRKVEKAGQGGSREGQPVQAEVASDPRAAVGLHSRPLRPDPIIFSAAFGHR